MALNHELAEKGERSGKAAGEAAVAQRHETDRLCEPAAGMGSGSSGIFGCRAVADSVAGGSAAEFLVAGVCLVVGSIECPGDDSAGDSAAGAFGGAAGTGAAGEHAGAGPKEVSGQNRNRVVLGKGSEVQIACTHKKRNGCLTLPAR